MAEENLVITIKVNDSEAIGKLDEIKAKITEISQLSQNSNFQHLHDLSEDLKAIGNVSNKVGNVAKNLKSITEQISSFNSSRSGIQRMKDAFGGMVQNLRNLKSAADDATEATSRSRGASSGGSIIGGFASSAISNFKKMYHYGSAVAKIPFQMLFSPMKGLSSRVKDLTKGFGKLFHTIGRVAFMRAIRAAIKAITAGIREGVNDLYLWASAVGNSFKPTMDSLATSFLYLKNSIGAAVSPILDALAPAVETAINNLVELLNTFNQVIATLTGASTWRKAIRSAADYSDNISGLGHDAEDANDSVKELKRTLLGFDEINRLDDKEKTVSNGSKGKDATGYYAKQGAFSFEEVQISQEVLDFVGKLKEAWDNADFTEIGSTISQKLADALEGIQWGKIQTAAEKVAKSVGTFLTGALSYNSSGGRELWNALASTVYNGINTALIGYTTFFTWTDFEGIGEGIGSSLEQALRNINWTDGEHSVAMALAALPNAIIDAVKGFNKRFYPQQWHDVAYQIGNSVGIAIKNIHWADFFQDVTGMCQRLLSALNGALEGFGANWGEIRSGIVNGIKSVPETTWKNIGLEIGKAIFNVANFVANIVNTLVSALKAGKWASVINGIWGGIDSSVKAAYGSWAGAALALGRWIVSNLDVISLVLAFKIGVPVVHGLAATWFAELMQKIKLLPTPERGLLLGKYLKNIALVAGIILSIQTIGAVLNTDFNSMDTMTALRTAAGLGLKGALGGAMIGLKFGGIPGALLGASVGFLLTLSLCELKSAFDQLKTGSGSLFIAELVGGILTAVAFLAFTGFNPAAGLIGFSIGVTLTLIISKIIPEFAHGVKDDATAYISGIANDPSHAELFGDPYEGWNLSDSTSRSMSNNNTYDRPHSRTPKVVEGVASVFKGYSLSIPVEPDTSSYRSWPRLVEAAWVLATASYLASKFRTAGVKDEKQTWWQQLTGFWGLITGTSYASRFKTQGVQNESGTWWGQLTNFWNVVTGNNTASKFKVGGVKNDSKSWWSDVTTAWTNYTANASLTAKVTMNSGYNLWNAFADAFNTLQTYFNQNKLTAVVQTSSSSGSSVRKNSGGNKRETKASGGVYKNGRWYDVTEFAGGGYPGAGQLFIAREKGPELVSTLNGSTAVMNNDQIVSSVSAGVAQAVASVLSGQRSDAPIDITVKVDSEVLYRAMKRGERMANGRYGTTVAVG